MRVCFYGHFTGGGTESACLKVANLLSKNIDIYIYNSENRRLTFNVNDSINYSFSKRNNIISKWIELFNYLRVNKIDVLISLEALSGIISLVPCFFSKSKYIIWEHANYYQTQGSNKIQYIRKLELLVSNAYVVLTNRDKKNFVNHFKRNKKVTAIYNIAEKYQNIIYNKESKIILSAGHIREIKNFKIIPDIGKTVFSKHPDWVWKIFGDGIGNEYDILVEKIKKYGLEKNIKLCGRSNNMEEVYKESSLYVMTSLQEGLPMVLLEAKSNKLPLISFDIETGPDEIIRDNVNGFLIPKYNIEMMSDRICELIENKEKRLEFSNNSILDLELFDKDDISRQWEELIRRV